ncbi:hypothetical protein [Pseudomonas sp. H2_A12]
MKTALTRTKLLASSLVVIAILGGATYYLVDRHVVTGLVSGPDYSEEQLNEGAVDDLHSLTLEQAKKRLNYLVMDARDSINQIAMIESMRLEISPVADTAASSGEKKQLRYDEPFVPFPAAELKTALEALAQKMPAFEQLFFDNQSGLKLNVEPIREVLKRGALPDQREEERYAVQTVYFRDGTQQHFAAVGVDNAEEQDTSKVELKVNKPVERVSVTLTYPSYPGVKKIVLDAKHPKVTGDDGEVYQLTALADDRASLLLAPPQEQELRDRGSQRRRQDALQRR